MGVGFAQFLDDRNGGILRPLDAEEQLHHARIVLGAETFQILAEAGFCTMQRLQNRYRRERRHTSRRAREKLPCEIGRSKRIAGACKHRPYQYPTCYDGYRHVQLRALCRKLLDTRLPKLTTSCVVS